MSKSSFDPMNDPMAPPREPCECWCMHCNRTFMSSAMWFQRVIGDKHGFEGFWMCPTPNCDGAGFTFDIFPTDPNHPANDGWSDDDGEGFEDSQFEDGHFEGGDFEDEADEVDAEWDPAEPRYAELDQFSGNEDDDLEGEEWKHGLEPGERPPAATSEGQRDWEEEQKRYEMPDERPRVLDWSNREDTINPDDIPF